ncbi:hypothetical protein SISSUDRAFT_1038072 [Sistotremastrum suecicum HHB10207 ss-3]|uniref:Uncharacterized protein n=1 Tax=Sistotremastrum suecicum HHB10207 ss-3 TaxID=1314776 RepID=A0A165X993_9AGAM|nr:hypothetical protein SISSUDRAFT_1038072 [Sistotremastrum suecicum HHB10207 ss-3]
MACPKSSDPSSEHISHGQPLRSRPPVLRYEQRKKVIERSNRNVASDSITNKRVLFGDPVPRHAVIHALVLYDLANNIAIRTDSTRLALNAYPSARNTRVAALASIPGAVTFDTCETISDLGSESSSILLSAHFEFAWVAQGRIADQFCHRRLPLLSDGYRLAFLESIKMVSGSDHDISTVLEETESMPVLFSDFVGSWSAISDGSAGDVFPIQKDAFRWQEFDPRLAFGCRVFPLNLRMQKEMVTGTSYFEVKFELLRPWYQKD